MKIATATISVGERTVPSWMIGCWRRKWIRFADGSLDTDTRVVWLQTFSGYADIRIPPRASGSRPPETLAACTHEDFLWLAGQQASCGRTKHTQQDGRVQARWSRLIGYELEVTFPEPGWMDWRPPDCMLEFAPSGAYEEDWRLREGSAGLVAALELQDTARRTMLYVVGDHAVRVRDRDVTPAGQEPLCRFTEELRMQHAALVDLLDCEFSHAVRDVHSRRHVVQLSTLPHLEGTALDLDALLSAEPRNGMISDRSSGAQWRVHEWGSFKRG